MSAGLSARFEIVRTEAGHHVRLRAGNGRIVWFTEVYARRRAAERAIEFLTGESVTTSQFSRWPEVSWAGNPNTVTEIRDVDERRPAPEPLVAEGPYWCGRADFWHDGDYHWRFCYGDECTQGTPPAGAEIAVRGGRTTLRADS